MPSQPSIKQRQPFTPTTPYFSTVGQQPSLEEADSRSGSGSRLEGNDYLNPGAGNVNGVPTSNRRGSGASGSGNGNGDASGGNRSNDIPVIYRDEREERDDDDSPSQNHRHHPHHPYPEFSKAINQNHNSASSSSLSLSLPLLPNNNSFPPQQYHQPGGGPGGGGGATGLTKRIRDLSRKRFHPFAVLSSFVFGILVSIVLGGAGPTTRTMVGFSIGGGNDGVEGSGSTNNRGGAGSWWNTVSGGGNKGGEGVSDVLGSATGNRNGYESSMTPATRTGMSTEPIYVHHESGHLFMSPYHILPDSASGPKNWTEFSSSSSSSSSSTSWWESLKKASSKSRPATIPTSAGMAEDLIEHPMHGLIRNATRKWENLLKRQSGSLREAVDEYKRRYGRRPPKGFDHWFKFAKDNDVILIDEYDRINLDILPFYSLPPPVLLSRAYELSQDADTHTFVVKDGEVEITGPMKELARAGDQRELMKRYKQWLPDMNITISAHDGPSVLLDWRQKERHLTAAKEGKYVLESQLDDLDDDPSLWGFPLTCPPDSRLMRATNGLEVGTIPQGPSYVWDHLKTMDLCRNPEWQYLHGFTAWPGPRPEKLVPLFSFAKTTMHSDLLLTPLEQFRDATGEDPEWEDKKYDKLVWRGSTTGVWFDRITWWRASQRSRLHWLGKDQDGVRRVRFVEKVQGLGGSADGKGQDHDGLGNPSKRFESEVGERQLGGVGGGEKTERVYELKIPQQILNERYVDAGFAGTPGQCTVEDGSCGAVERVIEFLEQMSWPQQNEYKYILDVDGNAWSGRFHRLLKTNSLVLKSTIFPEWYSDKIQPWVHFVPVKVDYTDLYDIMAFFSGDLNHEHGHEELAKRIAQQGKEFANKYWRWEDLEAYTFRLYLEWARVSAPDRSTMDYMG